MGAVSAKLGQKIDSLMEKAGEALVDTRYFECERLALEAFSHAHTAADYDRMARILMPMQEARRQKRLLAVDTGQIHLLDKGRMVDPEGVEEPLDIKPGCWLVAPPLVGADGRDLRRRADLADVPTLVVVREPKTRTGLWPIVMIGPVTVRAKVKPPAKLTSQWFLEATEALGDEAIGEVDPTLPAEVRVAKLVDRLQTLPDHEKLHQALAEACHEAQRESENGTSSTRKRGRSQPVESETA